MVNLFQDRTFGADFDKPDSGPEKIIRNANRQYKADSYSKLCLGRK